MAATGKTPILLYGSTTATNQPSAGNLTNSSDGCEIAINVADKNLFFKDSTNTVNTVPVRQSSASSNGWLSSTDWSTFNGKAPAFTYTTGYIPFGQGTTIPNQSANLFWDNTNKYLGLGTATPASSLHNSVSNATTWTVDDSGTTSYTPFATDLSNVNTSAGTLNTFAGIFLQGGANTGGGQVSTARIAAIKTTATFGTALAFSTRRSATGNLTEAGRFTETGDFNVHDGNVVIATSGKGIDFSATAGTGTSELLADYEEGTWTPTDASGAGLTLTINSATYTKIGRTVIVQADITYPSTASTATTIIGGLPYTSSTNGAASYYTGVVAGSIVKLGNYLYPANTDGTSVKNNTLSTVTIYLTATYQT